MQSLRDSAAAHRDMEHVHKVSCHPRLNTSPFLDRYKQQAAAATTRVQELQQLIESTADQLVDAQTKLSRREADLVHAHQRMRECRVENAGAMTGNPSVTFVGLFNRLGVSPP